MLILISTIFILRCTEITKDPNEPTPVVVDTLHYSAIIGEWEYENSMSTGEFSFDGKEKFSATGYYNGEKTGDLTGEYKTINGELFMYNVVATLGVAYDINATYSIDGNELTLTPSDGAGAAIVLTKKGTTVQEPELPNPPIPPAENNNDELLANTEPFGIAEHRQVKTSTPAEVKSTLHLTIMNTIDQKLKLKEISLFLDENNIYKIEDLFGGINVSPGTGIGLEIRDVPYFQDGTYKHYLLFKYDDENFTDKTMQFSIPLEGEIEEVVYKEIACETDFYTTLTHDVLCRATYTDPDTNKTETGVCAIYADNNDYGNICTLNQAIYIKVDDPTKGFSPVPGLSGEFTGVDCAKITTTYNSTRFFVNCINQDST